MTTTIDFKGAELDVTFHTMPADSFQEDFGCGMETCYPYGQGVEIEIEEVLLFGYIDITNLLSGDDLSHIIEIIDEEL